MAVLRPHNLAELKKVPIRSEKYLEPDLGLVGFQFALILRR